MTLEQKTLYSAACERCGCTFNTEEGPYYEYLDQLSEDAASNGWAVWDEADMTNSEAYKDRKFLCPECNSSQIEVLLSRFKILLNPYLEKELQDHRLRNWIDIRYNGPDEETDGNKIIRDFLREVEYKLKGDISELITPMTLLKQVEEMVKKAKK